MKPKHPAPIISVTQQRPLVDEILHIQLSGFIPHHPVTLHLRMGADIDGTWESQATYMTDAEGRADLTSARPVSGTYEGLDPMGLIWSAAASADRTSALISPESALAPVTTRLEATDDGHPVASTTVDRLFAAPNVVRTPLRTEGLSGTFFQPPGPGPHPCILALGGAAPVEPFALQAGALLASHGHASLALSYFGEDNLPPSLTNVRLEYFERAIEWLAAQQGVLADRVAVMGRSRGAELALLLGATFPQVRAVAAYAPSSVVWAGMRGDQVVDEPAWSYRGAPVPYTYPRVSPDQMQEILGSAPPSFTPVFLRSLQDRDGTVATAIPVERIQGPVLLVSGQDDRLWPSSVMADRVVERLARHNHPYPYEHRSYPAAGHLLGPPHVPTTDLDSGIFALGGTSQGQAAANADAWARVLTFLKNAYPGCEQTHEETGHVA